MEGDLKSICTNILHDELLLTENLLTKIDNYLKASDKQFLMGEIPTSIDYVLFTYYDYWIRNCPISERSKYENIKAYIKRMKALPVFQVNKKKIETTRPVDDPTRWKIVVGKVVEVIEHPESDKLWCEKIDIGEENLRLIGSGLRFTSNGMVICVSNKKNDQVILLEPPKHAEVGDVVSFEDLFISPTNVL
ncbi:tyrosine--tRNA ligase, cytoplasmic-like [Dermatophagoides farinae]|uniref:tyrosine--tRNA ligase, cytoplasmic-like n=1 Tax=Dermatophagoides farinae TaxID=6954 RepID=UPI003F63315F